MTAVRTKPYWRLNGNQWERLSPAPTSPINIAGGVSMTPVQVGTATWATTFWYITKGPVVP